MKKEEMKIGLYVGGTIPSRVLWFDERWAVVTNSYSDMPVVLDRKTTIVDPSTPAELTSAGVPDSQRLTCQRSEWSGVELWDYITDSNDTYASGYRPFVKVDGEWLGYVRRDAEPVCTEYPSPTPRPQNIDVTSHAKYQWVYQREDVLQAVTKFRSERREAGLKWSDGYGFVARVRNGVAEFWGTNKKWITYANQVVSMDRLVKLPPATPAQIAQSGCPIADVPESMKVEVERLRGVRRLAPSPSPAATRTAFDVSPIAQILRGTILPDPCYPDIPETITLNGATYRRVESLGTTAGGESK